MIIKEKSQKSLFNNIHLIKPQILKTILFLSLLLFGYIYGYISYQDGFRLRQVTEPIIKSVKTIVSSPIKVTLNYAKSIFSTPEKIDIDIKFKHYEKLALKREDALKNSELIKGNDDWVPATINYKNNKFKADISLKGLLSDHWFDQNWSFNVKIKDDKTIFGMAKFDLQHPRTRDFMNEWVYHKLLGNNDLINLRYKFLNIFINGTPKPIYALEEAFDKRLLENNKYREGLIFKIEENQNYEVIPYNRKKVLNDDNFRFQYYEVLKRIKLFNEGKINAEDIINIKKFGAIVAIADLLGNDHPILPPNIRFYFNPITGLIEPIGHDNQWIKPLNELAITRATKDSSITKDNFIFSDFPSGNVSHPLKILFSDTSFVMSYLNALEELASENYIETFFDNINNDFKRNLNFLHRSYPTYEFYSKDVIIKNRNKIRELLNIDKNILFIIDEDSNDFNLSKLKIKNLMNIPIVIKSINYENNKLWEPSDNKILYPDKKWEISLNSELSKIEDKENLKLISNFPSSNKIHESNLQLLNSKNISFFTSLNESNRKIINQLSNHNFITINNQLKEILIKPGTWDISSPLFIPFGYVLKANPGTHLKLLNNAFILCYSSIQFKGSEQNPIVIESPDKTSQGFSVVDAYKSSSFKYVHFIGLGNLKSYGLQTTGAVSIYNSEVSFNNCLFKDNISEDGLNIFRSTFLIESSSFTNAQSDALDIDFGNGSINNTSFNKSINDAIDFSGSSVKIDGVFISDAGDKGISVGENSKIISKNIQIMNSNIGVASKDLSNINIDKINLTNCKIGFAAYQKKSEFGGGYIYVSGAKFNNVETSKSIQKGSELILNP
tara:strand:- start:183 stop:2702 length:2520 start_codon:yes stop_codon:yes gene_type:complete